MERSSGGVVIEVRAKSGAYLAPFSDRPKEFELLHKHRQKYRIIGIFPGVEYNTSAGRTVTKTVVQLEEL